MNKHGDLHGIQKGGCGVKYCKGDMCGGEKRQILKNKNGENTSGLLEQLRFIDTREEVEVSINNLKKEICNTLNNSFDSEKIYQTALEDTENYNEPKPEPETDAYFEWLTKTKDTEALVENVSIENLEELDSAISNPRFPVNKATQLFDQAKKENNDDALYLLMSNPMLGRKLDYVKHMIRNGYVAAKYMAVTEHLSGRELEEEDFKHFYKELEEYPDLQLELLDRDNLPPSINAPYLYDKTTKKYLSNRAFLNKEFDRDRHVITEMIDKNNRDYSIRLAMKLKDKELLEYLAVKGNDQNTFKMLISNSNSSINVKRIVASNKTCSGEVMELLAKRERNDYETIKAIITHPNTPRDVLMKYRTDSKLAPQYASLAFSALMARDLLEEPKK